jgi:hypothetical protein
MSEHDAQLQWERRAGRWAGIAAIASVVLLLAAQIISASAATREEGDRAGLLNLHENSGAVLTATVAQILSTFLLAGVLLYLMRATRYRRTEGFMPAVGPLIMIAPVLVAVGGILGQLDVLDIAERFADSSERTERLADRLLDERDTTPVFIGYAGNIALGFGLVVVNLNAMRAGLETRFLGIIGIVIGALYVLPLFPGGPLIVQIFWLGALAAVFLDFWPGGRGEAWRTGTAVHWPSAAERRREELAARAAADADEEPGPEEETEPATPPRRRRKRRR